MARTQFRLRKKCFVAMLVFLLVFSFGCGFTIIDVYTPSSPPEDIFVWEATGNPDSMDPAVDNENFGNWVLSNIYETLYTYPFNSSSTYPLTPLLAAEEPSISPDGKNYTIELRQGITFHDSTPFNASCVKWNIERTMKIFAEWSAIGTLVDALQGGAQVKEAALSNGTDSSVFKITFDNWVANSGALEVLDVYTIRFVLENAFSPFVTILATGAAFVMSPTYAIDHATNQDLATWEAYGVDYGEYENYMDTHTCGTGPYMLYEWVVDQFVHLVKFDDYWRATETASGISPPSYAGSLPDVFIRINEDARGRELNLRNGLIDGCYWPIADANDAWDSDEETTIDPNIHVSTGGHKFAVTFFGFNMGNLTTTVNSNTITTESPFKNKHFRRSVSFAFNCSEFIEEGYSGFGVQGRGPIPIGMSGHNGSSFTFDYNIAAAVEEWNLAMQDPEFISALNAMNCSFTFYYIESSSLKPPSMDLVQQGLEDVFWHPMANHTGLTHNMTITVEGVLFSIYIQYSNEGRLPMTIFGWVPDYADPISYLYPLCHSQGALAQQVKYNNTDIDLWCDLAIFEIDSLQRQAYFNQIQDTIADEAPYLWAIQQLEFRTWRNWTSGDGLTFNPMRDVYFYHIVKNYPQYYSPYLLLGSTFASATFVVLLAYVGVNRFISPTLMRKRIKLALLAIYTGLALCLIVWGIYFFMSWPLILSILGLLWVPWCIIYSDYMSEHDSMKSTPPTYDVE
ncbi:MAG: hypothetical protein EAX95_00120 [Candidatus Thorarchaeota archaeon]|nr:hypothetical protein [Candidatus Thorarchaeota archaeon]